MAKVICRSNQSKNTHSFPSWASFEGVIVSILEKIAHVLQELITSESKGSIGGCLIAFRASSYSWTAINTNFPVQCEQYYTLYVYNVIFHVS